MDHSAQAESEEAVETPSGKGAGDENFPVGSRLIAAPLRPHVMAFYDFVRAADDIADNPALAADDKLRRLDLLEESLTLDGALAKPRRLAESLSQTGVDVRHATDMLSAFRQDATKTRYKDIDELWDYCDRSACPVGRYLVDLHGESQSCYKAADALSAVLQVLNHLQDCKDDFLELDRIYLPLDTLEACGSSIDDIGQNALSRPLRQTLDILLGACETRMTDARTLAHGIDNPRFAAEAAVIVALAQKLSARLAAEDPLAGRVKLTKFDFASAAVKGVMQFGTHRWRR